MRIITILAVGLLGLVLSFSEAEDTLVKFDGGIGVDPESNAPGPAADAATVTRNIVLAVHPAGLWVIHKLKAEVNDDGHITAPAPAPSFSPAHTLETPPVPPPPLRTLPHFRRDGKTKGHNLPPPAADAVGRRSPYTRYRRQGQGITHRQIEPDDKHVEGCIYAHAGRGHLWLRWNGNFRPPKGKGK